MRGVTINDQANVVLWGTNICVELLKLSEILALNLGIECLQTWWFISPTIVNLGMGEVYRVFN